MSNESQKKRASVLIATHDLAFGIKLADWLAVHGYQAVLIRSWLTMIDECRDLRPRAVVIDLSRREQTVSPSYEEVLRAIETTCPRAVVVVMDDPPGASPVQRGRDTALRYIRTQPADFAHIGRLLHSEIDHDATILPGTHAARTSHDQWTLHGRARQGERPSEINHRICHRCQGLMHPIDPLDPLDALRTGERDGLQAWRCISCGNLIDPVIIRNRHVVMANRARRRGTSPRQPVFKGAPS
ncbi:hypothetical protein [Candidatus Nitrospira inopinata]|jgi:ActR/RegA family two-component response regulator|uniref:Uncharacterized protein n=1 Tax=Candidatus Nitrospira inopinata TaxID=1715989 RepID=A0A0S4KSP0_9BACT|nr:hypothetical protein [Candidatus Nitrospira inopinata]CUQ65414.1 protein of unknown function [Candidatus Nitrospira inopinata]